MTIVFAPKQNPSISWARCLAWIGRQPSKLDVAGSNPAESVKKCVDYGVCEFGSRESRDLNSFIQTFHHLFLVVV